jgi:hypothetical protein
MLDHWLVNNNAVNFSHVSSGKPMWSALFWQGGLVMVLVVGAAFRLCRYDSCLAMPCHAMPWWAMGLRFYVVSCCC